VLYFWNTEEIVDKKRGSEQRERRQMRFFNEKNGARRCGKDCGCRLCKEDCEWGCGVKEGGESGLWRIGRGTVLFPKHISDEDRDYFPTASEKSEFIRTPAQ